MSKRFKIKEDEPAAKRFMLHRSTAHAELFSSAAVLDQGQLGQLASVDDTDVIAVLDSEAAADGDADPGPTLADICPMPATTAATAATRKGSSSQPPRDHTAAMLYYDPFMSFAPSIDSSAATSTYSSHQDRLRADEASRHWRKSLVSPSTPLDLPEFDDSSTSATDYLLSVNRMRLARLVRRQRARYLDEGSRLAQEADPTDEVALARDLAHLLERRPAAVLPNVSLLRARASALLSQASKEPGFSGLLEPASRTAVRESALHKLQ